MSNYATIEHPELLDELEAFDAVDEEDVNNDEGVEFRAIEPVVSGFFELKLKKVTLFIIL